MSESCNVNLEISDCYTVNLETSECCNLYLGISECCNVILEISESCNVNLEISYCYTINLEISECCNVYLGISECCNVNLENSDCYTVCLKILNFLSVNLESSECCTVVLVKCCVVWLETDVKVLMKTTGDHFDTGWRLVGDWSATSKKNIATSLWSKWVTASLLCMFKRLAATNSYQQPLNDPVETYIRPYSNFGNFCIFNFLKKNIMNWLNFSIYQSGWEIRPFKKGFSFSNHIFSQILPIRTMHLCLKMLLYSQSGFLEFLCLVWKA